MKLYWRYKKDGKWSWKPAKADFDYDEAYIVVEREEEE